MKSATTKEDQMNDIFPTPLRQVFQIVHGAANVVAYYILVLFVDDNSPYATTICSGNPSDDLPLVTC